MTTVNIRPPVCAIPVPAASPRRKLSATYHHGDLRVTLLAAARREVIRHGWHTVSLRALARRLRVSHAAAYRHFPSRQALLSAVAAAAMEGLADALERAERDKQTGGRDRTALALLGPLIAVGKAYVHFAVSRPNEFRLMFSAVAVPGSTCAALRAANDRASGPVVRIATRIVSARRTRIAANRASLDDVTSLAVQLWALVHGAAVLLIDRQLEEGPLRTTGVADARTHAVLSLLAAGLERLVHDRT